MTRLENQILQEKRAFIFDLDGVICDTAKFHFMSWQEIANHFNFQISSSLNESLKGVSRKNSLEKILNAAQIKTSEKKFDELLRKKNEIYLEKIDKMNPKDLLPGVKNLLLKAREKGIKIGLGSASKNAKLVLSKLDIEDFFETIIDGTMVKNSKPDPEVFLKGAQGLSVQNEHCIVFEDSQAGILAARGANMKVVAIGNELKNYDIRYSSIEQANFENIISLTK